MKRKIRISIILLVCGFSLMMFPSYFGIHKNDVEYPTEPTLVSSTDPIVVVNGSVGYTWSDYGYTTGAGTLENPYIIEDRLISAGNTGSVISISHSNAYAIIRKNFILRSGSGEGDAGIQIINCTNLNITHNEIYENEYGFLLENVNNTIIHNNTVYDNNAKAFQYMNVNNVNITQNFFLRSYTGFGGFEMKGSVFKDNYIAHNIDEGMYIQSVTQSIIHNNTIHNNTLSGIYIEEMTHFVNFTNNHIWKNSAGVFMESGNADNSFINNTIHNNTGTTSDDGGLNLYSYRTTIKNNTIYNNSYRGIYLRNADHSLIENNTIYNNLAHGIFLGGSKYVNFSRNIIRNNTVGIYFDESRHNVINNNEIHNNSQQGIKLSDTCTNASILDNQIYINQKGIEIFQSKDGTIRGNQIYNISQIGIDLIECDRMNVSQNLVDNNDYGIRGEDTTNSTFYKNNVSNNGDRGMTFIRGAVTGSHRNIIAENRIFGNDDGIAIYNSNNTILVDNNISSDGSGIQLEDVFFTFIIGNNISNNIVHGIYLETDYDNNTICANNIFNNAANNTYGEYTAPNNKWSLRGVGNYWGDYTTQNPSVGNNGTVWDAPYKINGTTTEQDAYPLVSRITTDYDGDGVSNYKEIQDGTDPLDPNSFLILAPTILTPNATIAFDNITVTWTSVSKALQYQVFVGGILNGTTASTSLNIMLHVNGSYSIVVRAVNGQVQSENSRMIIVTVSIPPLSPPTITTISQTITADNITISWTSVFSATQYRVYVDGILNGTTVSTSFKAMLHVNGTYIIKVTASNTDETSADSNQITIIVAIPPDVIPLLAPTITTTNQTITTDNITVAWTIVTGATQYQVYVNNVLNTTTTSTSFKVMLHVNGTYNIKVIATNSQQISPDSNQIIIKVAIPPTIQTNNTTTTTSNSGGDGGGNFTAGLTVIIFGFVGFMGVLLYFGIKKSNTPPI
jgi:parallel beta-helix repeat protein